LAFTRASVERMRADAKEERRLRIDNQPYGKSREVLSEMAYTAFPYKHTVIGSMADLDAAVVEDFQIPKNTARSLFIMPTEAFSLNRVRRAILASCNLQTALRCAERDGSVLPYLDTILTERSHDPDVGAIVCIVIMGGGRPCHSASGFNHRADCLLYS
jgi:hypothetical protein